MHVFGRQGSSFAVMLFGIVLSLCLVLFSLSPRASVRLGLLKTEAHVEIDGVAYGVLTGVYTVEDLLQSTPKAGLTRLRLRRDFVTEPSLYEWAYVSSQDKMKSSTFRVVFQNQSGLPLERYEFRDCKPISWVVEIADPSQGGFHEMVEVAAQDFKKY